MTVEKLSEKNVNQFIEYLRTAFKVDKDEMLADELDEQGIIKRITDPFYQRTTSLLAVENNTVVGRIEYHFYGCMLDAYRMCYVDWVYVLPEYRHHGVAQNLFNEMQADCRKNKINQFYLIRSESRDAERFYKKINNATLDNEPLLRKDIC